MRSKAKTEKLAIIFVCGIVATQYGCSTRQPKSPEQIGYHKLGEKRTECTSVYEKGGVLYIVQKDTRTRSHEGELSIYDPRTGAFVRATTLRKAATKGCPVTPDFSDMLGYKGGYYLNYISNDDFRKLFDHASDNPKALLDAIDSRGPYFRSNGKWKGERTATNLNLSIEGRSVEELAHNLRHIDRTRLASKVASRLDQLRRAERKREAKERRRRHAAQRYAEAKRGAYHKGDSVCTYDNIMGFVEDTTKDKVKVHFVAKGHGIHGMMFGAEGDTVSFYSSPMDQTLWLRKGVAAHCEFKL